MTHLLMLMCSPPPGTRLESNLFSNSYNSGGEFSIFSAERKHF